MNQDVRSILQNELTHLYDRLRELYELKEVRLIYEVVIVDKTTNQTCCLGYVDTNYYDIDVLQRELRQMLKDYGEYEVLMIDKIINLHKDDFLELAFQFATRERHVHTQTFI